MLGVLFCMNLVKQQQWARQKLQRKEKKKILDSSERKEDRILSG